MLIRRENVVDYLLKIPFACFQLSLCVLLAVVAAFIVEAAPQREKRQLDGSLGGLLGGGGYGNTNKSFIKCLTIEHDV